MKKIVIIGWYGTETIGDRAILAGLISFLYQAYGPEFDLKVGSLYPFFTERTVNEDYSFWKKLCDGEKFNVDIFDTKKYWELDDAIKWSDIVIMGGGPLMDASELSMVEYAFKKAKKTGKQTAVLGCGVGPLFKRKYQKKVVNIVKYSDLTIFRDTISHKRFDDLVNMYGVDIDQNSVHDSLCPSIEACLSYKKFYPDMPQRYKEDYIAVNLRDFPQEYSTQDIKKNVNEYLLDMIKQLIKETSLTIRLIPMHYFHVGSDDRVFLNKLMFALSEEEQKRVIVQNQNLSLVDTMNVFFHATYNIGMRYHAVVLQTLLHGGNYILDYTESKVGKISGFLEDIGAEAYHKDLYISLHSSELHNLSFAQSLKKNIIDEKSISDKLSVYKKLK